MKGRLIATVAALTAVVALSSGLFSSPAAAATSTVTTAVDDAAGGVPWAGTEVAGASAYDTASVAGDGTVTPTGTVTYSFFDNGNCTSDANTTTDTVTLAGGVAPNSSTQGPLGAGSYSFDAVYNGDVNNDPSLPSSCEEFTVGVAAATTSTIVFDAGNNAAWTGNEKAGAGAYDTATVTGVPGITPTGKVAYSFFDNGTCTSDANTTTDTVTLAAGVVPNSSTQGPLGAGSYSFDAVYNGDVNYGASSPSTCEPFSVAQAPSSTNTIVFDAGNNAAWTGNEKAGAGAYDTATVTGVPGITPTGKVAYSFFDNGTCTSDANTTTDTVTLAAGVVPNSSTQGPLGAGSYSFDAVYNGDVNYGASSPSTCEPFSVGHAAATTATSVFDAGNNAAWTGNEKAGAGAYDTATVTGVPGITPTGKVAYSFFDNGTCTSDANTTTDTVTLAAGVVPNSSTQGPLGAGSYSFDAVYNGDVNYGASSPSTCEPFSVAQAPSSTSTIVFDAGNNAAWTGNEKAGAGAYDTATVTGVPGITPTGKVAYSFFDNGTCTSDANTTTDTVTLAAGVVPNSSTQGPLGAGSYSFDAVYSGDVNYGASSPSTCEPFSVAQAPSSTSTIVFDAGNNAAWTGNEKTGAGAYDTATVTGVPGITPTGKVAYSFFDNGTCTSDANTTTDTVTLAAGVVPNSSTQGPLGAGSYSFDAVYSGDVNYGASSPSTCEPFSVRHKHHSSTNNDRSSTPRTTPPGPAHEKTGRRRLRHRHGDRRARDHPDRQGGLLLLRQRHLHH